MKIATLTLSLSVLLAIPPVGAETLVTDSFNREATNAASLDGRREVDSRSATDVRIDNRVRSAEQQRLALTRQYLMDRQYLDSRQRLDEQRQYSSGVGQGAANSGQAQGHRMDQSQGDVSVGSLVSESNSYSEYGQPGEGLNWQFAPQSNSLSVGGDNYAPINLSNVNANGGTVHIGDINKGNLYDSQIGNNQYGSQGGDTRNSQANGQQQDATSGAGSHDSTANR